MEFIYQFMYSMSRVPTCKLNTLEV